MEVKHFFSGAALYVKIPGFGVTKRRLTLNITTTLTEGTYHKRFAQVVEIINSGKPFPHTRPY